MSKYEKLIDYWEDEPEDKSLSAGERIIWKGKPKKNAFILNQALTMMPIALIWILFDGFFLKSLFSSGAFWSMSFFIIPFFAIHLMPVWIWLKNLITASRTWEKTVYTLTNKRIMIKAGAPGSRLQSIPYDKISSIELKSGFLDQLLHVGDIHLQVTGRKSNALLDMENAELLYQALSNITQEINDGYLINETAYKKELNIK